MTAGGGEADQDAGYREWLPPLMDRDQQPEVRSLRFQL